MKHNEINSIHKRFAIYKDLAEKAMIQINDEQFFESPNTEVNSIALTVKHVSGNLVSRFTDFYNSDGEKAWRKRDTEFENDSVSRSEYMRKWDEAWQILFQLLEDMKETDTEKRVTIRKESITVSDALYRQLAHYSYHIGQIVMLAKWYKGKDFHSLSIPRGKSDSFNS
jgi:hypothetical protein